MGVKLAIAMPFRFKKSETLEKAVRRVGDERIRAALKWLEKARRPAAIHSVRKEIKKLRALLRLVRGEMGRDEYRRSVKPLRRGAELLAASRDARVIFRALENLVEDAGTQFPKLHRFLRKHWRREARRLMEGNAMSEAERFLCKTRRQLRRLAVKSSGWMAIEPGLKQCYQRGQETNALAVREPTPENFHAWRKQVKTFWYQLQLICPKRSREAQNFIDELEHLGMQLGKEHDLVLLKQFIDGQYCAEADEVVAVGKLIETSRRKLRQTALKLGGQLFADEPATVCFWLKKYWRERRGG